MSRTPGAVTLSANDANVTLARAEAALADRRRFQREVRRAAAPGLVKKGGRTVREPRIVNPEFVKTGKIGKCFPIKNALILRTSKSKGFLNTGSWRCYWNSMLQVLLHAPPVYSLLGNLHRNCMSNANSCFPCALQTLAQDYWNVSEEATVSTRDIHQATLAMLPTNDPNLGDYHNRRQNDSASYLQFVLDRLEEVSDRTQRTSAQQVFYFRSQQHMVCTACGNRQDWMMNDDTFGFSLDIQTPETELSVEKYLREEMQEQGPFTCDSDECENHRKAHPDDEKPTQTRHTTLHYCPDVLIIRLSRFAGLTGEKIMTDNDFSEIIDLGPYTPTPTKSVKYRFSGLVAHAGATVRSGHYISVVRNPDQSYRIINDRNVGSSNNFDRDVKLPNWKRKARFQPYVLCYTRC